MKAFEVKQQFEQKTNLNLQHTCYICRQENRGTKFKCERCSKTICLKCRGICDYCKENTEKDIEEDKDFKVYCKKCIRKFKCDRNAFYSEHIVCESCSRLCKFCGNMTCYHEFDNECWFQCSKCEKEGCVICLCEDGMVPIPCSNFHRYDSRHICKDCSLKNPNPLNFCDGCSETNEMLSSEICQKCVDERRMPNSSYPPTSMSVRHSNPNSKEKPIYRCNCEENEETKIWKKTVCHECCIWKYRILCTTSPSDKRIESKNRYNPSRIKKEIVTFIPSSENNKERNRYGLSFCKLCEELYCSKCIHIHANEHEKNIKSPLHIFLYAIFHHNFGNRKTAIDYYQITIKLLRNYHRRPNNYLMKYEKKFEVNIECSIMFIGLAYEELDNMEDKNQKALESYEQCIQEIERKSNERLDNNNNNNMVVIAGNIKVHCEFEKLTKYAFFRKLLCFIKLQKWNECCDNAEKFLENLSPTSDMRMKVYRILAKCYGRACLIRKSLKYARKSIDFAKERGFVIFEIQNMIMMGDLLLSFSYFEKSIVVLDKALSKILKEKQETHQNQHKSTLLQLEKSATKLLDLSRSKLKECRRIHSRLEEGRLVTTNNLEIDHDVIRGMHFFKGKMESDFSEVSKKELRQMKESEKNGMGSCRILFDEIKKFKKKERKRQKKRIMCKKCRKKEKLSFEVRFKVCAGCRKAYYCSVECQKKDWKEHKLDCGRSKKRK